MEVGRKKISQEASSVKCSIRRYGGQCQGQLMLGLTEE